MKKHKKPKIGTEVLLDGTCKNKQIKLRKQYLVLHVSDYAAGIFTKELYGWCFRGDDIRLDLDSLDAVWPIE